MTKQGIRQEMSQKILQDHKSLSIGKVTLLFRQSTISQKKPIVIISISKKVVPLAVSRNYIKRVLRQVLRESLPVTTYQTHNWMWIVKEPTLTPELRKSINSTLQHAFST